MIRSGLIALGVMFAGSAFAQTPYTAAEMQALAADNPIPRGPGQKLHVMFCLKKPAVTVRKFSFVGSRRRFVRYCRAITAGLMTLLTSGSSEKCQPSRLDPLPEDGVTETPEGG